MRASRSEFKAWLPIATRWEDADVYGHVNNVKYYAYFDTVINEFLVRVGGLIPNSDVVVGYVVESRCNFFVPVRFPETVDLGLCVLQLSRSSVRYRIGVFGTGENTARAVGEVVHVFVDRTQNKSVEMPSEMRIALESIR